MTIFPSLLSMLLIQTVHASESSVWEKTVEKNAAAVRNVVAAASSSQSLDWGDDVTAKMSYDAYPVDRLVDPQVEADVPLLKDLPSSEIGRKSADWWLKHWPGAKAMGSTTQEIEWMAVVLGSEGKTLLTKTNIKGKASTKPIAYISRWSLDDDNKVYMDTDFWPAIPSAPAAGCGAEVLAAQGASMSTAVAFCAGVLSSAALLATMLMCASWKKRAAPTALQNGLLADH